ncbi:MAG: hypothetical protein ABWY63_14165 [Hyphomicrobiaceae bacterium]
MTLKQVIFDETSSTQDWTFQYRLLQQGHAAWEDDEEIVLGMSPDYAAWDDYGHRSRSFPPVSAVYDSAPFFQASSKDGTGIVVVTDPNLIDVRVPWHMMRQMGPGTVHVSMSWRRAVPIVEPLPGALLMTSTNLTYKLSVWAKRMGVPVASLMVSPSVLGTPTSRVTLVTGTLPVVDGVV